MKFVRALCLVASLAATSSASAHAPLERSDPVDGATVAPPTAFTLTFNHPVRLTSLTLRGAGADPRAVSGVARSLAAEHRVKAPTLAPGRYELDWRAAAADGHVMSGTVHFTVEAAKGPQPAATAGAAHSKLH
jgi:methionine-rich copper-binding protein CopC